MNTSYKKLITLLMFSLIWSGCYTSVRQSGGYYAEFDHADAKQPEIAETQPTDDDSTNQDEDMASSYDEDRDIYIQNYYGPEYPYPYGYWTPGWVNYHHPYYYGAGVYFGPHVRLAYVGTYWGYGYYDPFYDPYYYYDGWCYYPTGYGHHDNNPIQPSQRRSYGSRRIYSASATPAIQGISVASAGGGSTQRIYRTGNRNSGDSKIDQDRVRRNYRKQYGFETGDQAVNAEAGRKSRKANRESNTRNQETRETRQVRDNNPRNNDGERNVRSGERNAGRSGRNEGRSGESRSSGKRSSKN